MFRTLQSLALFAAFSGLLPAATFNVGYMFFEEDGPIATFRVLNLTGTDSNDDFPVLTDLSFSGTVTIRYCDVLADCSEPVNVASQDWTFSVPFHAGFQDISLISNLNFQFSQFTFNGIFLPSTPFDVGGVLYQPVNQALNMSFLGDPENPVWLFTIDGREADDADPIPEPSSLLLLGSGALLLLRRR